MQFISIIKTNKIEPQYGHIQSCYIYKQKTNKCIFHLGIKFFTLAYRLWLWLPSRCLQKMLAGVIFPGIRMAGA